MSEANLCGEVTAKLSGCSWPDLVNLDEARYGDPARRNDGVRSVAARLERRNAGSQPIQGVEATSKRGDPT